MTDTPDDALSNRPARVGYADPVPVRLSPVQLAEIDAWRAAHADQPSRAEAIRRLIAAGLASGAPGRPTGRATSDAAARAMADRAIDTLQSAGDATDEEKIVRRRRLTKPPGRTPP